MLFAVSFTSCKETRKDSVPEKKNLISKRKENTTVPDEEARSYFKFLESIQTKNIPLKEATNFDNYAKNNKLTVAQIQRLSLNKVIKNKEVINVFLNYNLNLSSRFKTLVVSYENGDSELMTALINYDNNYKLIDSKEIAYDEIAEGIFKIESEIKKNEIVCIETDYSNERDVKTTRVFTILENGKITKRYQPDF